MLNTKLIDINNKRPLAGIVSETGLSHDYFNEFFEYHGMCEIVVAKYKQYLAAGDNQQHEQQSAILQELREYIVMLTKLTPPTYTEWAKVKYDVATHLIEKKTEIAEIDTAVQEVQKLIKAEWKEKILFNNFPKIINIYNNKIQPKIDPNPERKKLKTILS